MWGIRTVILRCWNNVTNNLMNRDLYNETSSDSRGTNYGFPEESYLKRKAVNDNKMPSSRKRALIFYVLFVVILASVFLTFGR